MNESTGSRQEAVSSEHNISDRGQDGPHAQVLESGEPANIIIEMPHSTANHTD